MAPKKKPTRPPTQPPGSPRPPPPSDSRNRPSRTGSWDRPPSQSSARPSQGAPGQAPPRQSNPGSRVGSPQPRQPSGGPSAIGQPDRIESTAAFQEHARQIIRRQQEREALDLAERQRMNEYPQPRKPATEEINRARRERAAESRKHDVIRHETFKAGLRAKTANRTPAERAIDSARARVRNADMDPAKKAAQLAKNRETYRRKQDAKQAAPNLFARPMPITCPQPESLYSPENQSYQLPRLPELDDQRLLEEQRERQELARLREQQRIHDEHRQREDQRQREEQQRLHEEHWRQEEHRRHSKNTVARRNSVVNRNTAVNKNNGMPTSKNTVVSRKTAVNKNSATPKRSFLTAIAETTISFAGGRKSSVSPLLRTGTRVDMAKRFAR